MKHLKDRSLFLLCARVATLISSKRKRNLEKRRQVGEWNAANFLVVFTFIPAIPSVAFSKRRNNLGSLARHRKSPPDFYSAVCLRLYEAIANNPADLTRTFTHTHTRPALVDYFTRLKKKWEFSRAVWPRNSVWPLVFFPPSSSPVSICTPHQSVLVLALLLLLRYQRTG